MKNFDKIITVKKGGKKLFVIKTFEKGNGALKYIFGENGERLLPKLITRNAADALIERILQNQADSNVQVIGNIVEHTALQNLKTGGKIVLGGYI